MEQCVLQYEFYQSLSNRKHKSREEKRLSIRKPIVQEFMLFVKCVNNKQLQRHDKNYMKSVL